MATCVQLTTDGTLVPTGQPVSECAGYVMLSGAEMDVIAALAQVFAVPDMATATAWFSAAFAAPLVCFLVADMVATIRRVFD